MAMQGQWAAILGHAVKNFCGKSRQFQISGVGGRDHVVSLSDPSSPFACMECQGLVGLRVGSLPEGLLPPPGSREQARPKECDQVGGWGATMEGRQSPLLIP